MRLYLNNKEAQLIRVTLLLSVKDMTQNQQEMVHTIVDRMDLCDKLQNSERRAKDYANQ